MLPMTGLGLSTDAIADQLRHATSERSLIWSFRFDLLDDVNFQPIGVPNHVGEITNDITDYVDETLTINAASDNPVQSDITLSYQETPNVDFYPPRHLLRTWARSHAADGSVLWEAPFHIASFVLPDRDIWDVEVFWGLRGLEPTSMLNQGKIYGPYICPAGTRPTDHMQSILTMSRQVLSRGGNGQNPQGGDFAGMGIPASMVSITPSDFTLPAPLPFTPDSDNLLSMFNALADTVGYRWLTCSPVDAVMPLRFSSHPIPWLQAQRVAADWTYTSTEDEDTLDLPVGQRQLDVENIRNRWTVKSDNYGLKAIEATAENNLDNSLISFSNYGRWISDELTDNRIMTQDQADLRANIELLLSSVLSTALDYSAELMPFGQVWDAHNLEIRGGQGELLFGNGSVPMEVVSIAHTLTPEQWGTTFTAGERVGL
jgi:hypothetical protein